MIQLYRYWLFHWIDPNLSMNRGMKIIKPINTDIKAANSTAAAERSFAFLIISLESLVIESPSLSMAELNSSAMKTIPIRQIITTHSIREIESQIPHPTATTATTKCIRALCSERKKSVIPLNAYLKLNIRALIENCFLCFPIAVLFACKLIKNTSCNNSM